MGWIIVDWIIVDCDDICVTETRMQFFECADETSSIDRCVGGDAEHCQGKVF